MKILLVVAVLQLCYLLNVSEAACSSNGGCPRQELEDDCTECFSTCNCNNQNCNLCQGTDTCCQSCCDNRKRCYGSRCNTQCDCRKLSCSSCAISHNECCDSCCKCQPTKCNKGCGNGCGSVSCSSCSSESPSSCCNSCCDKPTPAPAPAPTPKPVPEPLIAPQTCCSPNITLPNITIVINQSPIYINNTSPAININNHCGNHTAVQGNGTHTIYVYANSSSCPNRTCCRIPWRRPCIPTRVPPYYHCPPSQPMFQCGSACYNPPAPQPQCYPVQSWPYYQCPTAGCVGYGCYQQYQQQNTGCYPISQWPYYQCPPAMHYGGGGYVGGAPAYGDPGYGAMLTSSSGPRLVPPSGGGGGVVQDSPMEVSLPFSSPGYAHPYAMGGPVYYPFRQ